MLTHCLLLWQEVAELTAAKDSLQVMLNDAMVREVSHLRWTCVHTKHSRHLSQALSDAQVREADSARQLSAAKQRISQISDELKVCVSSSCWWSGDR